MKDYIPIMPMQGDRHLTSSGETMRTRSFDLLANDSNDGGCGRLFYLIFGILAPAATLGVGFYLQGGVYFGDYVFTLMFPFLIFYYSSAAARVVDIGLPSAYVWLAVIPIVPIILLILPRDYGYVGTELDMPAKVTIAGLAGALLGIGVVLLIQSL